MTAAQLTELDSVDTAAASIREALDVFSLLTAAVVTAPVTEAEAECVECVGGGGGMDDKLVNSFIKWLSLSSILSVAVAVAATTAGVVASGCAVVS